MQFQCKKVYQVNELFTTNYVRSYQKEVTILLKIKSAFINKLQDIYSRAKSLFLEYMCLFAEVVAASRNGFSFIQKEIVCKLKASITLCIDVVDSLRRVFGVCL